MPAGDEPDAPAADDPWDALIRANTAPDGVGGSGRRISLELALIHCEDRLGASWVYAPGRWDTIDGFVPVRIVWARFQTLRMQRAIAAIDTARGIGLALGGEQSGFDEVSDEAFPEE